MDTSILNHTESKLVVHEDPNSPRENEDSHVVNRNVFYEGTDEDHDNKDDEEKLEEEEEDVF